MTRRTPHTVEEAKAQLSGAPTMTERGRRDHEASLALIRSTEMIVHRHTFGSHTVRLPLELDSALLEAEVAAANVTREHDLALLTAELQPQREIQPGYWDSERERKAEQAEESQAVIRADLANARTVSFGDGKSEDLQLRRHVAQDRIDAIMAARGLPVPEKDANGIPKPLTQTQVDAWAEAQKK